MAIVWGIVKFLILISFLVLIHEGGHFLTAKAVGMKVNQFAIGFGPKIWSHQGKETLYSIRWIPLGGFVALEGEEDDSDDPRAFNNKPVWTRFLVVVMGATVNIVFAIVALFCISVSVGKFQTTIVESLTPGSAGELAGIQVNDEVYAINGRRMRTLDSITEYLRRNKEKPVTVTVKRNGQKIDYFLTPDVEETGLIGVNFEENSTIISNVQKDSPAELAGIEKGDKILALNDVAMKDTNEIVTKISESTNVPVTLTLQRGEDELVIPVTPVCPDILKKYVIGFYGSVSEDKVALVGHSVWQSLVEVEKMVNQVVELLTGQIDTKYLSGPVGIATVVGQTNSGSAFLTLLIFISLNLGIVNLIPLPPLDGGKLVFLLIEGVTRKKVSTKVEMYFQMAGMFLLIALMVYVTFNDITRQMSIF
ncbi:MAG: RIP metalloprotease RseP [Clostridia bacterium]|nr:RIP metalloprotease RseP [Clostridia bacterium]